MNIPIKLMYPTDYKVGQKFGEHLLDYSQFGIDGHNGLDFPYPFKTKVYAPCNMEIVDYYYENEDAGYGTTVRARSKEWKADDGVTYRLEMVFAHLHDFNLITRGMWLKMGDIIAFGNSTGFSTGNHLHFGIRLVRKTIFGGWKVVNHDNGYFGYIDPLPLLDLRLNLNRYNADVVYTGKPEGARYYMVKAGELYHIPDEVVFFVSGYRFEDATQINSNLIINSKKHTYKLDYNNDDVKRAKDLIGFAIGNPIRARQLFNKYF